MVKKDYNYQTKRISHRILRRAISSHLPNLESKTVLCFPGAEAREILEVYDPLGIPRRNIYGCEKDGEIYQQIKDKNLGINLFNQNVTDFLEKADRRFDVISLDYTQTPNPDTMAPILLIGKNHLLSGRSVFYTNFYASRISDFITKYLPVIKHQESTVVIHEFEKLVEVSTRTTAITGKTTGPEKYSGDLKGLKDIGISTFLLQILSGNFGWLNTLMTREKTETHHPSPIRITNENESVNDKFKTPSSSPVATVEFVDAFYRTPKPYLVTDLTRFSYVSDDGSLMMSDIVSVSDFAHLFEKVKKYFHGVSNSAGKIFYNMEYRKVSFNKSVKRFSEIINRYNTATRKSEGLLLPNGLPKRVDITPREELDQETAIKLLRSGWTYEMFESKFKNITPARIGAYKAHITMGTYEKTTKTPEEPKQDKRLEERVFKKGIIFFDSNAQRLRKNLGKVNFGKNPVKDTSVLQGFKENPGILMMNKQYGLYIVNTLDPNAKQVISELALRYCESNRHLNLLLIGDPHAFDEDISAARELGAKINVASCETPNGYINTSKTLSLESLVSDIPATVTKS